MLQSLGIVNNGIRKSETLMSKGKCKILGHQWVVKKKTIGNLIKEVYVCENCGAFEIKIIDSETGKLDIDMLNGKNKSNKLLKVNSRLLEIVIVVLSSVIGGLMIRNLLDMTIAIRLVEVLFC